MVLDDYKRREEQITMCKRSECRKKERSCRSVKINEIYFYKFGVGSLIEKGNGI